MVSLVTTECVLHLSTVALLLHVLLSATLPTLTMQNPTQKTRGINAMVGHCWASVVDDGPTMTQHCINVYCMLGTHERPSPHSGLILAQCRRLSTNIRPSPSQYLLLAVFLPNTRH